MAEAADGHQALAAFAEHQPDVLVPDPEMPGLDGLNVASRVLAEQPGQSILILTRHARPGMLRSALKLGVRGFLGKPPSPGVIAEAIAHVAEGGRHVDPSVSAQALIDDCPLTEAEKAVLRAASDGYSIADMSHILDLAQSTVRNYLSSAIGKTRTTPPRDAARFARQQGWIKFLASGLAAYGSPAHRPRGRAPRPFARHLSLT